ncbi:MAG: glycosyltransferase family 2 protein [Patescibacteria group bacterium]
MNVSAIIVAEGACPDINLTISSSREIANEIILVDIGIEKTTRLKIQAEYEDMLIEKMDKPEFVELIRQDTFSFAKNDWILLLDPDEYLSPDLVRYIQTLPENIIESHTHFKIPRQNYIFGKWISHSRWWPDYQVRLFRKDSIQWPRILHSQPLINGKGYVIPAFENEKVEMNARTIVHHNYTGIIQYLEKAVRYSRVEADEIVSQDKEFTLLEATRRATSEFISRFFAEKGYKDGVHGFLLAVLQMFYCILVFCFVWEKRGYNDVSSVSLHKSVNQMFLTTSKEVIYWMRREKLLKGTEAIFARLKAWILSS